MQFTTTIFTLYLAALSVAAPASLEKRVTGSITLFADKDFGGASQTFNFDVDAQTCIAATLPAGIDAQASSVRLSAENGGFNCRLTSAQNCEFGDGIPSTWFFNVNIPDLGASEYGLDDQARSITCGAVN